MSLPLALTAGTVIGGNYVIDALINSGGFGAVYRAIDTSEGNRPCAVKETYDVTPSARRQALMEASVLFTVRDSHLPQVYDAFEANGRFYLVMQLIEGQNLLQLLKERVVSRHLGQVGEQEPHQYSQGPCSEQEVLSWLLPIMDVLQELHSRNPAVVHRDIKPGNIILTPDQTAVLVDFGLTKLYDPKSSTQTLVRAVSEGFSPIEQYTSKTGPQSDMYSLAATMYLLLTNRLPPPAVRRSIHDELIAPRLLNPTLSLKAERALLKALSVQADQRYQSMREFAQALREPSFDAYADTTIAAPHVVPSVQSYPQPSRNSYSHGLPTHAYAAVPTTQVPYSLPQPSYSVTPPASTGYGMAPQTVVVQSAKLPGSFSQGCLFGLVQAVLAALLVLFLKKEAYFYLATFMGFLFYTLAGFTTTYRGGGSARGSWSGMWAGIVSTVMFWVVLGIGLVVLLSQRIEVDTTRAQKLGVALPRNEINRAWQAIQPAFPNHPLAPSQPPSVNFLVVLGGGLLIAFALGWLGGMLGTSRHRANATQKKHS